MTRRILVTIDSNRVTCGECTMLQPAPSAFNARGEWWCDAFDESRGYVSAQRSPNRSQACLDAERAAEGEVSR